MKHTPRSARTALTAGLALTTGLTTGLAAGCSTPRHDDWVPLDEALTTRQDVRNLTQELAAIITDQGLEPYGADGYWTTCTDDGYAWEYDGSARLDSAGPAIDILEQVLDAMASDAGLVTDGPGAYNNPEIARGTIGDLDIRVRAYADDPAFMLDVFGPCLPIAPDDRDDLAQGDIGSQDLDIGGPHHVGPDPAGL